MGRPDRLGLGPAILTDDDSTAKCTEPMSLNADFDVVCGPPGCRTRAAHRVDVLVRTMISGVIDSTWVLV